MDTLIDWHADRQMQTDFIICPTLHIIVYNKISSRFNAENIKTSPNVLLSDYTFICLSDSNWFTTEKSYLMISDMQRMLIN